MHLLASVGRVVKQPPFWLLAAGGLADRTLIRSLCEALRRRWVGGASSSWTRLCEDRASG